MLQIEAVPASARVDGAVDFRMVPGDLCVQRCEKGEHILLRWQGLHLRMDLLCGTVLDGPIVPRIMLTGFHRLTPPLLTLKQLTGLTQRQRIPRGLRPPERRSGRWAQMIQALDGTLSGGSHRDVAIALFGSRAVNAEWRGVSDHLRLKVQRLVREARRLADGGYRALLQGGVDGLPIDRG